MSKISGKQQAIYEHICAFIDDNGYPPSVREIGKAVGLKSASTVHTHIKKLKELGYIQKNDHISRGLSTSSASNGVPILGKVTAGSPIFAFEEERGQLNYRTRTPSEHFALEVRGDSMINAGILSGDYVVVHRQESAENGQIVVALLEDEATVKKLLLKKGEIWLMPENDAYEPIDGSDCRILGKVVAVVREI